MELSYFREIIHEYFEPTETYNTGSYPAKHILERNAPNWTYVTDEQFISLMKQIGYKTNKKNQLKIKPKKNLV